MVNKLETEVSSDLVEDFEAYSSVSFTSFLAGYNCSQQLYINEKKQFSNLVYFSNRLNKARPGSYLVNKLDTEVSSDLAGDFEAFFSFFYFILGWLQLPTTAVPN